MSGRKILITGGTGFLGRNLLEWIDHHCHEFVAMGVGSEIDILDTYEIQQVIDDYKPDIIFHLAGIANPSYPDKDAMWYVNVNGVKNVLDCCQEHTRFILASSINVFGDSMYPGIVSPSDIYGASKVAAEALVQVYTKQKRVIGSSLRLCGMVGPYMTHGFLKSFIDEFKQTGIIKVYGNEVRKPILHVEDVCMAFMEAVERYQFDHLTISNKDTINTLDIAKIITDKVECVDKYISSQKPYDGKLTKLLLDWEPVFSSADAIKKELRRQGLC